MEFMDYLFSLDKNLRFNKDEFEKHCVNEAVAEAFAIWLLDPAKVEPKLMNLFDSMKYKGKGLKESE